MIKALDKTPAPLTVRLSSGYIIAFISLRHIVHELHEFAHMIIGRWLCGVWGTRDFNNVHPMSSVYITTHPERSLLGLEGPFVNYFLLWLGAMLIVYAKSPARKSWGFTLVFASLPFARCFTALIGGGDEYGVIKTYISNPLLARMVLLAILIAILFYPLYTAYKALNHTKFKGWFFIGFLILPMLLEGMAVLLFFNYLLKQQVLNIQSFMGSPLLVYLVLFIAFIVCMLTTKNIKSLFTFTATKAN